MHQPSLLLFGLFIVPVTTVFAAAPYYRLPVVTAGSYDPKQFSTTPDDGGGGSTDDAGTMEEDNNYQPQLQQQTSISSSSLSGPPSYLEAAAAAATRTMANYDAIRSHRDRGSGQFIPMTNKPESAAYDQHHANSKSYDYSNVESTAGDDINEGYANPKPSASVSYDQGSYYQKDSTVKDIYDHGGGKLPGAVSGDIDTLASEDQKYGSYGSVTGTDYKTGYYLKPKSSRYYPKHYVHKHAHITHEADGPSIRLPNFHPPNYDPDQEGLLSGSVPQFEIPGLDKLIPDMNKSPVKFPTIDFNYILGNIFGGPKEPPKMSFHMPEDEKVGNFLATLVGHHKPTLPSISVPNLDLLGNANSNTKTQIKGFDVPQFAKFVKGLSIPKLDLSGTHASGLHVPHIDLPVTSSKAKDVKLSAIPPLGPSIHFLKHIPLPSVPKIHLPEIFKNIKIPNFDLTKIQKKDSMVAAEDSLQPAYVVPPVPEAMDSDIPPPPKGAKPITIVKPKKIVTAYPLLKGPLTGHVVIEDYPFGRQPLGPDDDGGEPEIGCAELDKVIQTAGGIQKPPISDGRLKSPII